MSVRTKILSVVVILLVMLAGVMVFALHQINAIGDEIGHIRKKVQPLSSATAELTHHRYLQSLELYRAFGVASQIPASELEIGSLLELSENRFFRLSKSVAANVAEAREVISSINEKPQHVEVLQTVAAAEQDLKQFETEQALFEEETVSFFSLLKTKNLIEADKVLSKLTETGETDAGVKARTEFMQKVGTLVVEAFERARHEQTRSLRGLLMLAAVALTIGLFAGLYVTRQIADPLGEAATVADEIGRGNRSIKIDNKYGGEIGRLLSAMASMNQAISENETALKEQAGQLAVSNSKLAVSNSKLAESISELEEMNKEIARSNEELEQFAYVASHDLQEPLRMIGSYTKLLERRYKGKLDKDADEFINFIVDGVSRMQGLILDLLAFSRIGTRGKDPVAVSAQHIFNEVNIILKVAIAEAGATLTSDELPYVMGDETQLVQVFQNLIGNAIKFKRDEAPKIHVAVQDDGAMWRFAISDNGIGIPSNMYERVFLVFQRLHKKGDYPGTGVGLAIVKKVVDRLGGRIWLESEEGKGSTFYFTLLKAEPPKK